MEEISIGKLKQRRNGIRFHTRKILVKTQETLEEGLEADEEGIGNLRDKLSEYAVKLASIDEAILTRIDDEEEQTKEIDECGELGNNIFELSIELTNRLKKLEKLASQNKDLEEDKESFKGGSESHHRISAKLPKLTISKYDGQPLRWREFWDSFESSIHSNEELKSVDKFNYLKGLLTGEAEQSIRGIAVTNANYKIAIDTIKERFGNEQTVIFAHFEELFRLQISSQDTRKLRTVYDECERHIRGLEAMGVTEDKFGIVFVPLILSKLPEEIRVSLNRTNSCKNWELSNLRQLLKQEIIARELSEGRSKQERKFQDRVPRNVASPKATAEALLTNSNQLKQPNCAFCGEEHYSDQCIRFPDVQSRKGRSRDKCFICLRSGHFSSSCKSRFTCVYCGKKHHRSLCLSKFGTPKLEKVNSKFEHDKVVGFESNSCNAKRSTDEAISAPTLLFAGQHVLMQFAETGIVNLDNNCEQRANILLDTGSQRSFITSEMMNKLKLRPVGQEIINIAGFGARETQTMKLPVVKLHVKLIDGSLKEISANVVPVITCPIQRISLDIEKYTILKELSLAYPISSISDKLLSIPS